MFLSELYINMPLLHSSQTLIRCQAVEFDLGMFLGELYINMPLLHSSSLKHCGVEQ